ncbi:membrane protein of unknown function [Beijerinckiaceae bacterium RH AL1]|nr:hypothetical protein [Beijerinckiaceae bacterium]VVB43446.1 membrane protein of unknown function [Beijerinckiaceae bacterium RH AL8]VVB43462.1 membrane protein of unknown function [Beijerinckiaceae bacterium RH CH11]VVC53845.1 membrane protein of unknown function [Beijerinckiaceae bacterium RH AL1]
METPDLGALTARRRTQRQEDGFIYKMMAFVVFGLVALPVGYALTRSWGLPGPIELLVGVLVFNVGFDLALLWSGRGDMFTIASPRVIVAKSLENMCSAGIVLLFILQRGELRYLVGAIIVAWLAASLLSRRKPLSSADGVTSSSPKRGP